MEFVAGLLVLGRVRRRHGRMARGGQRPAEHPGDTLPGGHRIAVVVLVAQHLGRAQAGVQDALAVVSAVHVSPPRRDSR